MKKFLSLSMAALLAGTMVMLSFSDADARHKRRHGVAAGVAAGIIGGAIIGGAIANSNRRRSNRHCHRGYCHRHNYEYSDHRHRPVVYDPPPRRRAPPRREYGDRHEDWCYDRYRSYRARDNTYQPYRGGRRYCRSPYG